MIQLKTYETYKTKYYCIVRMFLLIKMFLKGEKGSEYMKKL